MQRLTDRQKQCLKAIDAYKAAQGYAPSIRQLCEALGGIGTNAVFNHLIALEEKGYIKRDPAVARSIQVLKSA